jgi:hypothetical protein
VGWKLVTNHTLVLCLVAKRRRITAREIAVEVGITEKATRSIIKDLETAGYVTKRLEGRCLKYRINPDLPLRRETEPYRAVGDLLTVFGWKRPPRRSSKSPSGIGVEVG